MSNDLPEETYYVHRYSPKTGKRLAGAPYRWHRCECCGERALVEHGIRNLLPKQGRCVFCDQQRLKKETPE